jgi:membrane protease subunit HflK
VEPEEIALITRFGRYVSTAQPGPHFKWPLGVDSAIKVPVQRQLKEEFGFRTTRAGVQTQFTQTEDSTKESIMLTGDLNVANVEWIVQYKIKDPYQYTFRMRDVRGTLRDVSETVMRKVVGDNSVTEVLTVGRERIQLQAMRCNLCRRDGHRDLAARAAGREPTRRRAQRFNGSAKRSRASARSTKPASYNAVIPEAQGKSEQAIQSAEGYATERYNAHGDVQRLALQTEYQRRGHARALPGDGREGVTESEAPHLHRRQRQGVLPLFV